MPAPTVVYFSSTDTGAPTLNNVNGSLIALLDACLINGYNLKTITTLTVAADVATATCAGHGFPDDSVNLVEGATPAGLNGNKRVTVVDANTFTFDATGIAAGAATGTITIKRAPLGWEKQFSSGTTKAVYQRTDSTATAAVLRIDDVGSGISTATFARARMHQSMTSVDAGSDDQCPVGGDGQFWFKGANSATAKRWVLVGDSRTFYLFTDANGRLASHGTIGCSAFGDFKSYRSGDPWATFLCGSFDLTEYRGETGGIGGGQALGDTPTGHTGFGAMRPVGSVVPAPCALSVLHYGSNGALMAGSSAPPYPSPVDNGCVIVPTVMVFQALAAFKNPIRGEMRGLASVLGYVAPLAFQRLKSLLGSDRDFLVVPATYSFSAANHVAFDVTGPWA